eukprot:CAMPEP_0184659660 /NCGR_PEP_ID=MMETSP0308-20130426/30564_1 /TAXON_ID=38269 /ORGANISM="Gloeochaete witrockiana, Strain SAG 46.84" /LENGTH=484 /DNA_ID=CAMNT_0027099659 /DNA_START=67 /DNA_END=1521 /DNA_ORIENTATION=-
MAKTMPKLKGGLPFLGHTLTFLGDPYAFKKNIFEEAKSDCVLAKLFGRDFALWYGLEAMKTFYKLQDTHIIRYDSTPDPLKSVFGGSNALPYLDGDVFRQHKAMFMAALSSKAIEDYIGVFDEVIEKHLRTWVDKKDFTALQPMLDMWWDLWCTLMFGEVQPKSLHDDLWLMMAAGSSLPVNLGCNAWAKGKRALDRVFPLFEAELHKQEDIIKQEGPSSLEYSRTKHVPAARRFVAARGTIPMNEVARDFIHMFISNYITLTGAFIRIMMAFTLFPDQTAEVREEVRKRCPPGTPLTKGIFSTMPKLCAFAQEVRRFWFPIAIGGGTALVKENFTFEGYEMKKGMGIIMTHWCTGRDPRLYTDPDTFNFRRFLGDNPEPKVKEGYCNQGWGDNNTNHTCPAVEYAFYILASFATLTARSYEWTCPAQDMSWVWMNSMAGPKDSFKVTNFRRYNTTEDSPATLGSLPTYKGVEYNPNASARIPV